MPGPGVWFNKGGVRINGGAANPDSSNAAASAVVGTGANSRAAKYRQCVLISQLFHWPLSLIGEQCLIPTTPDVIVQRLHNRCLLPKSNNLNEAQAPYS